MHNACICLLRHQRALLCHIYQICAVDVRLPGLRDVNQITFYLNQFFNL